MFPLISEYIEAIKSAEDNFNELSYLKPVLDEDGLPKMTSGNFAVIFKMKDERDGKFYAIKCFIREQEGRAEAYRQITEELKDVKSSYFVSIHYYDKEIYVDTKQTTETKFPVLLMDWVEGKTLDKYLRENLDDKFALEMLAYRFSQLAQWLIPQPYAHGDLKPDNILVRENGSLALVDYDGMYVPAMKGQKARELGSPDFRHPLRTKDDFDEHIDDFPFCSLLLSLKAISINPLLLEKYGSFGRFLFSKEDYLNISNCYSLLNIFPSFDMELNRLISTFLIVLDAKNIPNSFLYLFQIENKTYGEQNHIKYLNDQNDTISFDKLGIKYNLDKKQLIRAPIDMIEPFVIRDNEAIYLNSLRRQSEKESINIPTCVTVIKKNAFRGCRYLNYIIIPNTVEIIEENAFEGCTSLFTITIPDSVKIIGNNAFRFCDNLRFIFIPKSVEVIGENIFQGCSKLESIVVDYRNNYYDSRDMSNAIIDTKKNAIIASCSKTIIPHSIKIIGKAVFHHSNNLKISIPDGIIEIEKKAFSSCKHLNSIILPSGLLKIGDYAFSSCSGLTSLTISNSVNSIGEYAFSHCHSLKTIVIPNGVTNICKYTFSCCSNLTSVTIPNSVASIGDYAFIDCI